MELEPVLLMYHHCLRLAYDLAFDNKLLLNGEPVKKKSTQVYTVSNINALQVFQDTQCNGAILRSQVKEGDIIEVDIELRPKGSATAVNKGEEDQKDSSCSDGVVKRGRVVVLEIGERTKKGGYHMKLSRCKNYAVFKRKLSTLCQSSKLFYSVITSY